MALVCKGLWADPLDADDILSTAQAYPYVFVTNQNNTTSIWAKAYDGKNLLLYKNSPIIDASMGDIDFKADMSGNFLGLTYTSGNNQTKVTQRKVVADLKNDLVTAPASILLVYSSDGLGVYYDPENHDALIIKPLFGVCKAPMILTLDKQYDSKFYWGRPTFNDSSHLEVDYISDGGGGVIVDQEVISINSASIFQQCGQ